MFTAKKNKTTTSYAQHSQFKLLESVTVWKGHRMRVLRRLFGTKGVEVAGGWRRLH